MFNNVGVKDAFKFHDGCLKSDPKPSDDKRRLTDQQGLKVHTHTADASVISA